MWDIHRSIDAGYFGEDRTVLLFEFSDYSSRHRRWWLVVGQGDVDVCMKDPGHDIDLHLLTDVKTLTGIWMGDISITKAIRNRLLTMSGSTRLRRDIRTWLGTNYFADFKPARA
jgi:hypothetical protein